MARNYLPSIWHTSAQALERALVSAVVCRGTRTDTPALKAATDVVPSLPYAINASPRREEAERHEPVRDRPYTGAFGRHDQVISDPAAVEAGFLGRCRGRPEPPGAERLPVVRQDQTEVRACHRLTLSTDLRFDRQPERDTNLDPVTAT